MKTKYITNRITSLFEEVANTNNLIARYENDNREIPDEIWCNVSIDLGHPFQKDIYFLRYVGNLNVGIKDNLGLGLNNLLTIADEISSIFKNRIFEHICFQIPRIVNVGKIRDSYQLNVICPFFIDSNYLNFLGCYGSSTGVSNCFGSLFV